MKLDDILNLWAEDSTLDKNDLSEESVRAIKLHSKYYIIYSHENLRLAKLLEDVNKLYFLKYEYYLGDLDKETLDERGWKQFQKKILKSDIDRYIRGDDEVIALNLRIALQKEKVTTLKDIIKSIGNLSFTIGNILNWRKFQEAAY
ncbi:MAG: hypothetical protein COA52_00335 [Hyphomicrobiales bacterium]|nr:MAG: hypothetical protein COA52_00335 [Hyphomicrobiales bacterium]